MTKVEFFQSDTKLGEVAYPPFIFSWTGMSTGTYSLTAKATDDDGAITTSSAVMVKVVPPWPEIVSVTATPDSVIRSVASLGVVATDDGGEENLTYTWSCTSKPDGAPDPVFDSGNGTNAGKLGTAVFNRIGTYTLSVTVQDGTELSSSGTVDVTIEEAPYGDVAPVITATGGWMRIEAENFDVGAEGIAFHEIDESNFNGYRSIGDEVDLVGVPGGPAMYFWVGEWVNYTVDVAQEGDYTIAIKAGNWFGNAGMTVAVVVDGNAPGQTKLVHGSMMMIVDSCVPIHLPAGRHVIALQAQSWQDEGDHGLLIDALSIRAGTYAEPVITAVSMNGIGPIISLSAEATDDNGEAALTYTWGKVLWWFDSSYLNSSSPDSEFLGENGTNVAKNLTERVHDLGTAYRRVTVQDGDGLVASAFVYSPALSGLAVSPGENTVPAGEATAFTGEAYYEVWSGYWEYLGTVDNAELTWSVAEGGAGGTIDAYGVYTAPAVGGTDTVVAYCAAYGISSSATVTVTDPRKSKYAKEAGPPRRTGAV